MRDGNDMYISPSGFDIKGIEPYQWMKVDITTGEIEGNLRPPYEVLMHALSGVKLNEFTIASTS